MEHLDQVIQALLLSMGVVWDVEVGGRWASPSFLGGCCRVDCFYPAADLASAEDLGGKVFGFLGQLFHGAATVCRFIRRD